LLDSLLQENWSLIIFIIVSESGGSDCEVSDMVRQSGGHAGQCQVC